MKTTTPECAALLQSNRALFMVELFTLTLQGGTVIRWACSDLEVKFGATTWAPGPLIERGKISNSVGIVVTSCDVTLHANDVITVLGVPLLQAARRGVLDGASMLIEKGFAAEPGATLVGTVHLFEGKVGDIEVNSTTARLAVKHFIEVLDTQVPVDVYQATCLHTLYSPGCGLTKSAHALNLTVGSGSTRGLLLCGVTGSGVYDLGELVFTSGANAGLRRAVKVHTSGQLALSFPLPELPAVGDGFTVYKGCNKLQTTCFAKFANVVHFRGFPYVPAPETAV